MGNGTIPFDHSSWPLYFSGPPKNIILEATLTGAFLKRSRLERGKSQQKRPQQSRSQRC